MFTGKCTTTGDTVTIAMSEYLEEWNKDGVFDTYKLNIISQWAEEVSPAKGGNDGVFASLSVFSDKILTSLGPDGSSLQICSSYIYERWRDTVRQKSPVDDRQYYAVINGWMIQKIISFQVQAIQVRSTPRRTQ